MIKNLKYLLFLLLSFLLLSYLSGALPTESLKYNIIKSFDNEDLTISDDLDFNLVKGQHQYQDCLVLSQALNLSTNLSVNALMPPVANSKGQCLWLYQYTKDFNPDLMKILEPYEYYNHGNKTLISFIASILPIHTIRGLLKFISTGLIFLSAILLIQIGYKNKQNKLFSLIEI